MPVVQNSQGCFRLRKKKPFVIIFSPVTFENLLRIEFVEPQSLNRYHFAFSSGELIIITEYSVQISCRNY